MKGNTQPYARILQLWIAIALHRNSVQNVTGVSGVCCLSGSLHEQGAHPSGIPGSSGEAERWSRPRTVGKPFLGAALCHQWRWGTLQYPSTSGPPEESEHSSSRPSPWLPRSFLQAPPCAFALGFDTVVLLLVPQTVFLHWTARKAHLLEKQPAGSRSLGKTSTVSLSTPEVFGPLILGG